MSSVGYRDKTSGEIQEIVAKYCENYERVFGKAPEPQKVKERLAVLIKAREQEVFLQAFGTLSTKNLSDSIQAIDDRIRREKKPFYKKG